VRRSEEEEEKRKKGWFYDREKESQRLDWDSRWSTPSLSPLNSGDLALDEESDEDVGEESAVISEPVLEQDGPLFASLAGEKNAYRQLPHTYAHRREFEVLQEKQYWREGWKGDITVKREFSMGDASTLGEQPLQFPVSCEQILTRFILQVQHCAPSYVLQVERHALLALTLIFFSSVRYAQSII